MTVHRFFVPADAVSGERFTIPATIERQVRGVLRLRTGDRVILLTGDGDESICRLDGGDCVLEERRVAAGEPAHRLTVLQALIKGDGLEEVIQHGTELGVASFRLWVADRSVARDLSSRRLDRLRAIAREAAEQSERGLVPDVDGPVALRTALQPGTVVLHERTRGARLRSLPPPRALVIGPEGGFSDRELALARSSGVTLAGLGPRILRSETVALAAAAVVLSGTGDFA